MPQVRRDFEITNTKGLHARAATALVKVAAGFASDIKVSKGAAEANGKSVMSLLILAAAKGSTVTIQSSGDDADEAMTAIGALITSGFGEIS